MADGVYCDGCHIARENFARILAGHEISRFPCKERPHMPGSTTTPGRPGARGHAPVRVAFRQRNSVGTREEPTFAARWLACALPYRRFADLLADIDARLGANAVVG